MRFNVKIAPFVGGIRSLSKDTNFFKTVFVGS